MVLYLQQIFWVSSGRVFAVAEAGPFLLSGLVVLLKLLFFFLAKVFCLTWTFKFFRVCPGLCRFRCQLLKLLQPFFFGHRRLFLCAPWYGGSSEVNHQNIECCVLGASFTEWVTLSSRVRVWFFWQPEVGATSPQGVSRVALLQVGTPGASPEVRRWMSGLNDWRSAFAYSLYTRLLATLSQKLPIVSSCRTCVGVLNSVRRSHVP